MNRIEQSTAIDGQGFQIRRNLRAAITFAVLLAVVATTAYALSRLLADINYTDLTAVLEGTSWYVVAASLGFTALSFAALSIYDRQALEFVGQPVPFRQVALASFCAFAVGNIAGFGPLTGGAIRYRFYSPLGLSPEDIARIIGFVTLGFAGGLAFTAAVGLIIADNNVSDLIGMSPLLLRLVSVAILVLLGTFLLLSVLGIRRLPIWGRQSVLPGPRSIIVQLAATVVDILASASVLWVLLPASDLAYPAFLSIYAVAIAAGIISHVPGGIGIFETVVVGAIGQTVPVDALVGALLLYRVIYYVVPLVVAVVLLTFTELRRATQANPAIARATAALLPVLASALAVIAGAMLIFSGVTPTAGDKLDWLEASLPLPLVEGAHFLASSLGVVLIVAGRGLVHRLNGAWFLSIVLSALSIPLALVKGLAIGEAVILAVLLLALVSTRRIYDRPASLIDDRLSPGWWFCILTILVTAAFFLFFIFKEVDYSQELWWQFEFSATAPRSLRAALAVTMTAAGVAVWWLTRAPSGRVNPATPEEVAEAVTIVGTQQVADGNLVRSGDKSILFSANRRAFLMYGKRGRSWIAFLGPIGNPDCHAELVWRFVELARRHGGRAAFYQVPADSLSLYADAGLFAYKLGEEARIPLAGFDLKGHRRASFRNAINKSERDGITFEILQPDDVTKVFDQLKAISDLWLAEHRVKEKGFSLGTFHRDYVLSQPVAILRRGEDVLAFATLSFSGNLVEASCDLMRFRPDAPNGAMEVLFVKTILAAREAGYQYFSLGMAPLSGLSENPSASLWHKVGRAAFDHGERFYNFHGLRAFKNKFDPDWQPRYLAVAGGLNPVLALADVTVLISGGLKGAISK